MGGFSRQRGGGAIGHYMSGCTEGTAELYKAVYGDYRECRYIVDSPPAAMHNSRSNLAGSQQVNSEKGGLHFLEFHTQSFGYGLGTIFLLAVGAAALLRLCRCFKRYKMLQQQNAPQFPPGAMAMGQMPGNSLVPQQWQPSFGVQSPVWNPSIPTQTYLPQPQQRQLTPIELVEAVEQLAVQRHRGRDWSRDSARGPSRSRARDDGYERARRDDTERERHPSC